LYYLGLIFYKVPYKAPAKFPTLVEDKQSQMARYFDGQCLSPVTALKEDPVIMAPIRDSPPIFDMISSSSHPSQKLSVTVHPWPQCFSAAISKLLDEHEIPNFIWGDLLNKWRGNPHLANVRDTEGSFSCFWFSLQVCGFVVAAADLDKASTAIMCAGLPVCHCKSPAHEADPASRKGLPIHFVVTQEHVNMLVFLCPNDILLNLIPLTSAHPNPATLQFDQIRVSLYDRYFPLHVDEEDSDTVAIDGTHKINVLKTESLIKLLLLLDVLSRPARVGVGHAYTFLLIIMVNYAEPCGPYDFESQLLQRLWDKVFVGGNRTAKTREVLSKQVEREWRRFIISDSDYGCV
jgi:hypothetical protein